MVSERIFKTNEKLGYAPAPLNTGIHFYNSGKTILRIPTITDENGRRISRTKYPVTNDTTLLFLGCSYTWGDYSLAEDTYPYLTSKKLRSSYTNAGVCGYGLAQMKILADELIPAVKPGIVLVQYSPWLVDRATTGFTPTFFGTRFSPYFTKIDGKDSVIYPKFLSYLDEVPFEYYKRSAAGFFDKLSFLKDVGYPVILKPFLKKIFFKTGIVFGKYPDPNTNKTEVEKYFYEKIYQLCKLNNAKMVVVNLGIGYDTTYNYNRFKNTVSKEVIDYCVFADAQAELCKKVKDSETYCKAYAHQYNRVIYDMHPNAQAGNEISDIIVKCIKK
ncbi:MAG TPA: hypothetical protein VNZ49_14905 [Bacteroidia bacterium]|jgi:hypothetical protein|nr:hypothetical protein [Bacteroidia bacterium]